MPYRTALVTRDGLPMVYDSGDYVESQRRALEAAGWHDFETRRAAARRQGRLIGIGMSNYVEGTGRGPFESAAVRIGSSGRITVTTGAAAQGQGTETMLAQIAADAFGVDPREVHVISGDTAASPLGLGAFASRQAVTAGNAVNAAARMVADKARLVASTLLEAAPDDLEFIDGAIVVKGVPELRRSIAEVAHAVAGVAGFPLPGNMAPGLAADCDYQPPAITYTNCYGDQGTKSSSALKRKFIPDGNVLESRLLLSRGVAFPDGSSFVFPTFTRLPRTGGALIQSGTALTVGVGQRTSNTVQVTDGVRRDHGRVEWPPAALGHKRAGGPRSNGERQARSDHDQPDRLDGFGDSLVRAGTRGSHGND